MSLTVSMVCRKAWKLATAAVPAVMSDGLTDFWRCTNWVTKRCIALTTSAAAGCFSLRSSTSYGGMPTSCLIG